MVMLEPSGFRSSGFVSGLSVSSVLPSSAELNGDKIKITLNTDGKNYEKLYLGSKEDPDEAKNAAAIVGSGVAVGSGAAVGSGVAVGSVAFIPGTFSFKAIFVYHF